MKMSPKDATRVPTALLATGAAASVGAVAFVFALAVPTVSFVRSESATAAASSTVSSIPQVAHVSTPTDVKAIYMSQCAAGTSSFRESLTNLIDDTELNAIVIDIRDYTGKVSFPVTDPLLQGMASEACGAKDMKEFVAELHKKGIYVIGRITTFQNPHYVKLYPEQAVQKKGGGVWHDYKGLGFVDVGAKPYWDTVVALAKESHDIGFDEINFDYIRFPSDGPMSEAVYSWDTGKSKAQALEEFFKYLHESLAPTGVVMSADLFGMVTTNYDDLNIGQVLERALSYFDYIDPMVYPSHYPKGFQNFSDVNAHSYEIVRYSMGIAVERTIATSTSVDALAHTRIGTSTPALYAKPAYPASKMRPWLQSFDYPVPYTPAMVKAQIKANEDSGLHSYLFWDAANKYRSLKQVLSPVTP